MSDKKGSQDSQKEKVGKKSQQKAPSKFSEKRNRAGKIIHEVLDTQPPPDEKPKK